MWILMLLFITLRVLHKLLLSRVGNVVKLEERHRNIEGEFCVLALLFFTSYNWGRLCDKLVYQGALFQLFFLLFFFLLLFFLLSVIFCVHFF